MALLVFIVCDITLALCIFVMIRNQYVYSTRIEFIYGSDWERNLASLPSRASMVLTPKYWLLWTEKHWRAWAARQGAK